MMNIHGRIEHNILEEKLSIAAFERQIDVGRNSLSTSLRKQSEDIEIEKLSVGIVSIIKRWRDLNDKNICTFSRLVPTVLLQTIERSC